MVVFTFIQGQIYVWVNMDHGLGAPKHWDPFNPEKPKNWR